MAVAAARRRPRRKPHQLSAAARGYGYLHQKIRAALIAAWTPGDPCTRCGQPMWGPPRKIHLGHTEDRTAYTGLEHEACNTSEGASRGNRARATVTAAATVTVRHSRQW